MYPKLIKVLFILYPRPSIFIAFLETKCSKKPKSCFLHFIPAPHFKKGPSRKSSDAHDGHLSGIFTGVSSPERNSLFTLTSCGITSPALLTRTLSLSIISRRFNSSILCKEIFEIFAPAINTGSIVANGVITPVLPTEKRTFFTLETFSVAGNFHATAHLGALDTKPSFSCLEKSSTLTTAPSIS